MEPKHFWIIGIVATVGLAAILGMTTLGSLDAMQKCEEEGYGRPSWSLDISSCPADEDYAYDGVAMVVGNVANSPVPKVTKEANSYLRNSLAKASGELEVDIFSATPGGRTMEAEGGKARRAGNVSAFIRNANRQLSTIDEVVVKPSTEPHVDYFNNILTAARSVKSSPKVDNGLVLVVGSGLSDSQPLNFTQGDLLHADPMDVVEGLERGRSFVPGELSGVTVVWSGIGATASPQTPLDASEKSNLEAIYRTVLQQMGAQVRFDNSISNGDSVRTEYEVDLVSVNGISGGLMVFKLGEDSIEFRQDTASLVDEAAAKAALVGVIQAYQSCPAVKVTIEGYQAVADGGSDGGMYSELSQSRADTVKRLLVSEGLAEDQVNSLGKGTSDFEGRVNEYDSDGKWSEDLARQNRVVLIHMDGAVCGV